MNVKEIKETGGSVKVVAVFAMLFSAVSAVCAVPEPVSALLKEMQSSGSTIQSGYSPELGVYMVGIGRARFRPGALERCREVARMHAVKEIASAIRMSFKSHDVASLRVGKEDDAVQVKALLSSMTESSVNQMVSGVQVVSSRRDSAGAMEVAVYAASNMPDAEWTSRPGTRCVMAAGISVDRGCAERNALLSAVEQVAGTLVVGKVSVNEREEMHKKLAASANAFVEEYRVTKDEKVKAEYRVEVLARVNKRKLYEDYRSFFKCLDNPVFCIVATDESLTRQFTRFFVDKGFHLTTKPEESDYLIRLDGRFADRPTPGNDKSMGTMLCLNVKVVSADETRVLLSMNETQAKDSEVLSPEERREEAARRIFEKAEARLHKAIHDMIVRMLDSADPLPTESLDSGSVLELQANNKTNTNTNKPRRSNK